MEDYFVKGSSDKPFFSLLTNGEFEMGGASLPENVLDIFDPVSKWMHHYFMEAKQNTKIDMYFEYLNTASSRILMKIIQDLNQMVEDVEKVLICWHFQTGDYDMKEFGQELMDESNCKFEIIENANLGDIVTKNLDS